MKNKEVLVMIFYIVVSLFLYTLFPVNNVFQKILTVIVFFVVLPLLFNGFIMKKDVDFYGLKIGDWKQGMVWSILSLIIISFIFFIASRYFNFFDHYTISFFMVTGFVEFIFYELVAVLFVVAVYEFYFRGFLMSILKLKFGYWAILMQGLVFLGLVLSTKNGAMYSFLPYLLFAPFAGWISYKSKSIIYSGVSQFLVIFFLDIIAVKMVR